MLGEAEFFGQVWITITLFFRPGFEVSQDHSIGEVAGQNDILLLDVNLSSALSIWLIRQKQSLLPE